MDRQGWAKYISIAPGVYPSTGGVQWVCQGRGCWKFPALHVVFDCGKATMPTKTPEEWAANELREREWLDWAYGRGSKPMEVESDDTGATE